MKFSRFVLGSGWVVSAFIAWFAFDEDVQRAYPSPEQLDDVYFIGLSSDSAPSTPRVPHDFNGDGIPDFFWVEYFHVEPLFARSTSGLLRVYSGANHSTLLARTVATPLTRVEWCGDSDHNGTDDLCVVDQEPVVLAHISRSSR